MRQVLAKNASLDISFSEVQYPQPMEPTAEKSGLVVVEERSRKEMPVAVPDAQPHTPMQIIERAARDPSYDMAKLRELFAWQKEMAADEARKAFIAARAKFKGMVPNVTKDRHNKQYESKYTSIGNLVNTVSGPLSECGLEARWDLEQNEKIKVTCILSHVGGHSERAALSGPPDKSGAKNDLQQIKSTVTYLKIATFEAVTGTASAEGNTDDDGSGGKVHMMDGAIKDDYAAKISAQTIAKELEALWATIASECTKCGDVTAYEELKKLVIAQAKAIKKAEGAI